MNQVVLKAVLGAVPVEFLVIDADDNVLAWNRALGLSGDYPHFLRCVKAGRREAEQHETGLRSRLRLGQSRAQQAAGQVSDSGVQ
jgi:hypothetical protein